MAVKKLSEFHKATIGRHWEESRRAEVPLDEIHRELLEIFSCKGRYSLPQITAVTSWLASSNLSGKRVESFPTNEIDPNEKINEDVDFDNEPKNKSREWFMSNFAKNLSEDMRDKTRFLLLPGQYTHDLDAVTKSLGIPGRNLLTFIRGDVPRANAEYVRNARRYGVTDRRIGDMTERLPHEGVQIGASYLDFFGQYCPSFDQITKMLPLEPNRKVIPLGFNFREGREHDETVDKIQALSHLAKNQANIILGTSGGADQDLAVQNILKEGRENHPDVLRDARDRAMGAALFSGVGIARPEQWILNDSISKFVMSTGENSDFDDLEPFEKFRTYRRMIQQTAAMFHGLDEVLRLRGSDFSFACLGSLVGMATVNSPITRSYEEPKRYISPNGNTPFISFFATVETIRDQYLKHVEAIQFYLDVVTHELSIRSQALARSNAALGRSNINIEGSNSNSRVVYTSCDMRNRYGISCQKLTDFMVGIGDLFAFDNSLDRLTNSEAERVEIQNAIVLRTLKNMIDSGRGVIKAIENDGEKIVFRVSPSQSIQRSSNPAISSQAGAPRVGRNDPCPCGSGHKFKKCCIRPN